MEFIREDCIYARQSVDRKDSISIESQIDFCKYELKGGSCRVFKDKGYSGKNTDRPEFQKLLGEIRKGKVRRVIVYKLDRISRSILDFATMMELFQEYDVEFVSSTEKFDTSTPMGRAMYQTAPDISAVPNGRKTKAVRAAGKSAKKNLSNSFSRPCRRSSKTFRYSTAGRKKSIRS